MWFAALPGVVQLDAADADVGDSVSSDMGRF
jgi:hypothetical protein